MPWRGCRSSALRSYTSSGPLYVEGVDTPGLEDQPGTEDPRLRRLQLEGRQEAFRVTNEAYRWVSDPRFHPSGDKVPSSVVKCVLAKIQDPRSLLQNGTPQNVH
jgi:hypothetical protein